MYKINDVLRVLEQSRDTERGQYYTKLYKDLLTLKEEYPVDYDLAVDNIVSNDFEDDEEVLQWFDSLNDIYYYSVSAYCVDIRHCSQTNDREFEDTDYSRITHGEDLDKIKEKVFNYIKTHFDKSTFDEDDWKSLLAGEEILLEYKEEPEPDEYDEDDDKHSCYWKYEWTYISMSKYNNFYTK